MLLSLSIKVFRVRVLSLCLCFSLFLSLCVFLSLSVCLSLSPSPLPIYQRSMKSITTYVNSSSLHKKLEKDSVALKKVLTSHSLCLELLDIKKETFISVLREAKLSCQHFPTHSRQHLTQANRNRISTILSFITV